MEGYIGQEFGLYHARRYPIMTRAIYPPIKIKVARAKNLLIVFSSFIHR
jgi:hypothetical protein